MLENRIPDIELEYRTDTIRDTIRINFPVPYESIEVDKIPIPDVDSLVIEQVTYKDSLFTAWVSGYMPNLDSIHINSVMIRDSVIIREYLPLPSKKVGLWIHLKNRGLQSSYFGIGYILQ